MKYGTIAEGSRINAHIYRCFEHITEQDARKFVKKFKEQPHDQPDIMHTFYELIVGSFLRQEGISAHYDLECEGKTPDWSIKEDRLTGLVEVAAFHTDKKTRDEIRRAIDRTNMYVGWLGSNTTRLYPRIQDKAVVYKDGAEKGTGYFSSRKSSLSPFRFFARNQSDVEHAHWFLRWGEFSPTGKHEDLCCLPSDPGGHPARQIHGGCRLKVSGISKIAANSAWLGPGARGRHRRPYRLRKERGRRRRLAATGGSTRKRRYRHPNRAS